MKTAGLDYCRAGLFAVALSLILAAPAALAVDYRWTLSFEQGTLEAIIQNGNDLSLNIFCPEGQEDTTPGMILEVKGINPKLNEEVLVQFVVDGQSFPFNFNEIKFDANSRANKWAFRAFVLALTGSKQKSFVAEFPKYKTSETFSLLDARKLFRRETDFAILASGKIGDGLLEMNHRFSRSRNGSFQHAADRLRREIVQAGEDREAPHPRKSPGRNSAIWPP